MTTATAELRERALAVAGSIEPEVLSGEAAAEALEDLAMVSNAASSALMFLGLRVARTSAWQGQGHLSAADWLAAKVGVSVFEANRLLGTAKKADRLPRTKDAMKRGDLSPDQADAVAGAAAVDPSAEDDLLGAAANETHKKLQEEAARRKAAATDSAARERRIHGERSVRRWNDGEGAFNLRWRGPAADGARLEALLRPFEEQSFRTGRREGVRDTFENRSYDAMAAMLGLRPVGGAGAAGADPSADASATPMPAGSEADVSAEPGASAGPGSLLPAPIPVGLAPVKLPGGNNVKVIVRIDHAALARGHTVAGETCDVVGVGPISVAAARDLMADAFLAAVITKGRDVVNVAHLGRGLNAYQRTAIEAMGLRCSNVACNRTIAIQIDHRVPYATNPETALANQDGLCPTCHPNKTHHGWHLERGTGPRRFLPPGHPDNPLTTPDRTESQPEARGPTQNGQPTLC